MRHRGWKDAGLFFSIILLALVGNRPKVLNIRELLEEFQETHKDSPRKQLEAYLAKSANQKAS